MKMKRYITYMLMALAMALMFVISGCGGLGNSQDFSGTWGYIETPSMKDVNYEYSGDKIYLVTFEKKTDHTYTANFRQYRYAPTKMNFLNMDEYERGDRWMVFGTPTGPNRQGLLPKMEPEYTFKEMSHDFKPFNLTERDGVLYIDESGTEYTYDSKNDTLVSGKLVMKRIKDGDLSALKAEAQQHIKDYFQKKYVDTKKWDLVDIKFTDETGANQP